MKTDLKPTDPEYIEAVALKYASEIGGDIIHEALHNIDCKKGYQLALSHTNHAELVEKVKQTLSYLKENFDLKLPELEKLVTKSETSKL